MKVKATKVPQDSKLKAGEWYELTGANMDTLTAAGHEFVTKAEEDLLTAREASVDNAIKASKHFLPKEDDKRATVKATALNLESIKAGSGVEYIQSLPEVKASGELGTRVVPAHSDEEGARVEVGDHGLRETIKEYMKASEPFTKTHRQGGIIRACNMNPNLLADAISASRNRAIVAKKLADMIAAGADFRFDADLIKAGDYADPASNNPLGVLNTGLTLQWNLGHLENQLAPLNDITTDVSNTPALFNQVVRTRYLTIPKGMLKTTSNAWPVSGAPTGTDVDVNVTMDSHFGVPLSINNNILGSTARQLFNEQKMPQLYAVGEYITYKLVYCIMNGSTRIANDGTTTSTQTFNASYNSGAGFNVAGATLATFVADLPEAMDESKFPGGDEAPGEEPMRFVWVHGRVYAAIAADTNFILNQSIQGIRQNSAENLIQTGRYLQIGNTKIRKSQLVTDQCAVSGSGADSTTNGITVSPGTFAAAQKVGFAGTRSSLIFASRVPQDYTKVLPDIPNTAAVELVSSPQLGITFMVVKFLDHSYETANMRAQIMFGQAIGDERQGMHLTK